MNDKPESDELSELAAARRELQEALALQRRVTERLLLTALREQDLARQSAEACMRAAFVAHASRDLAMSLSRDARPRVVQRSALPRQGTWCIVDVVESSGAMHRLAIVHPDPDKQGLARTLVERWNPQPDDPIGAPAVTRAAGAEPIVITHDSGAALLAAAHGPENLAILRELDFGSLLVVPLRVRATVLGAMTFITREGDAPFSPEEISLASDLADHAALVLDNARLYRETDALRDAAKAATRANSVSARAMTHELLAPLNAIGAYAELMALGLRGSVSNQQRTDLARIKQNQQHLLTLIAELLNVARTESGRT